MNLLGHEIFFLIIFENYTILFIENNNHLNLIVLFKGNFVEKHTALGKVFLSNFTSSSFILLLYFSSSKNFSRKFCTK